MRPKIVASNALQWWPKTASFCIFATLKCCVYFGWSVNSFLCSVKARNSWLVLTICSKSRSFQISWLKQSESAEFWQNKQTHSFGFARIREISVICQIREMGTYLTIDAEHANIQSSLLLLRVSQRFSELHVAEEGICVAFKRRINVKVHILKPLNTVKS